MCSAWRRAARRGHCECSWCAEADGRVDQGLTATTAAAAAADAAAHAGAHADRVRRVLELYMPWAEPEGWAAAAPASHMATACKAGLPCAVPAAAVAAPGLDHDAFGIAANECGWTCHLNEVKRATRKAAHRRPPCKLGADH